MASDTIPSGLSRRELWVDARDLQSEQTDGTTMTDDEYKAVLTTRGTERLSENQLVRSFDTTVRTQNPTYQYGTDFNLGDTITAIDDRLSISIDAVVQGVQKSNSREGESMALVFGYSQPTLTETLHRKADK